MLTELKITPAILTAGNRRAAIFAFGIFNASANDWLTIIDESHITVPQIRGMCITATSGQKKYF